MSSRLGSVSGVVPKNDKNINNLIILHAVTGLIFLFQKRIVLAETMLGRKTYSSFKRMSRSEITL